MKLCFATLLGVLVYSSVFSQNQQGRLKGVVTDNARKVIAYSTVTLINISVTKITYTDSLGSFEFLVDTGSYQVAISHVGYPETNFGVTIKPGENILDTIQLKQTPGVLQNVIITSRKPLIEQADDRLIYNVDSDPAAKSETASDILRKTPMITVDGDGNVQLNGQNNFKILLNGRETSMFAQNVKDALRNFPGAIISKIEIITSPSAKYDAEGVGGLINIVTKKRLVGYNGYVSSYYSTLSNYSESVSINLKSGRIGLSAYYGTNGSINQIGSENINITQPLDNSAYSMRTLSGNRDAKSIGAYGNLELIYELDSFNAIALYGNLGKTRNEGTINQLIYTQYASAVIDNSYLLQDNSVIAPNTGVGLDFIKKYRHHPDRELNFRFNGQFSNNDQSNNSFQDNPTQDKYVLNNSLSKNQEYTFQIDYVQPLKSRQKIETGIKTIIRKASSDFENRLKYNNSDESIINPLNSDRFSYQQKVYSIYGSYSFPLDKSFFRLGLRGEHTNVKGDFQTSKTLVKQSYTNVIPNLLITTKLSSNSTLTLSYSLRLQRPYITSLNPFVNNNDSLDIVFGNPRLGPQILHSVNVQDRITTGKTFFTLFTNANYSNNAIVQFQRFNSTKGITSTTSENAGKEIQLSLGFGVSSQLSQKLSAGINSVGRYNNIQNKLNVGQTNDGFSGVLTGNFQYKVVKDFSISGSGGLSRGVHTLLSSPAINYFYQVNFGYRLFNNKLAVTMNVNNFHAEDMTYESQIKNEYFRNLSSSTIPFRVIYFGATYSFGQLKESISKKKGVSNDDLIQ